MTSSPTRPIARGTLAALAAAALALASAPAEAELAKWNAERVSKHAADLAQSVKELRDEIKKVPAESYGLGSLQARRHHRVVDNLRLVRNEARHLASHVKQGESREETEPVYQRLGSLVAQTREDARKLFLPEPVLDKMTEAYNHWRQISPYYDPDWDKPRPGGPGAEDAPATGEDDEE